MSTIDRKSVVRRHNIHLSEPKPLLQVGNGEFTFNFDTTGLQTFAGNTMSHWAWHSFPLPPGYSTRDVPSTGTHERGRLTGGQPIPPEHAKLYKWMYENPHRTNLSRLRLVHRDGSPLAPEEIGNPDRHLNLWTGLARSRFQINSQVMQVETCCHPTLDLLAFRMGTLELIHAELKLMLDFGYPVAEGGEPYLSNWEKPGLHQTLASSSSPGHLVLHRVMNEAEYDVVLEVEGGTITKGASPHEWIISASEDHALLEIRCWYGKDKALPATLPDFSTTSTASVQHWENFWLSGGAIDLSESRDKRWFELERRIVLSHYVLAVQSNGSMPPQESGLHHNSWNGQSHMEMIWWHLAHYALWNRWTMAEKTLSHYQRLIPAAKELAQQLGYKGLKWPKMIGPEGRNAPWSGHNILLWLQPHPILFAELEYRAYPEQSTLERWQEIVLGTAEHMADYAQWDEKSGHYVLDPVMPDCELGIDRNTVFELAYWRYGLEQAQIWRTRLGLDRNPHWDEVLAKLAPLPTKEGVFQFSDNWTDTFTTRAKSHPDPIGPVTFFPPAEGFDHDIAHATVLKVWEKWDWKSCWGWDFPWMAMAASRVGEPQIAIEALLHPAAFNQYAPNGINSGWYVPGNGSLLYAIAFMAAGWDGAPKKPSPGFPDDGSWTVKFEGLRPAP